MSTIVQEGIGLGLILSLAVGPILFMLIQITVEKGFWAGILFSAGVWISDFFYVGLVYFGVTQFAEAPDFKLYMGVGGGILLILFGIALLGSDVKPPENNPLDLKSMGAAFGKGVAINVFNPFVLFLWISVTGTMIERDMSFPQSSLYFLCIIGTVALTDIIKTLLAQSIRDKLTIKHLTWIRKFAGLALVAFGVFMWYRVF
ncbi:MAG: LysE family translocator [Bacteroidota bacterium]